MADNRRMSDVKPSRGATRVREASPASGKPASQQTPLGFKVTVTDRGRIVLPAEVRERLKIKDGDWLTLILEPDGVIKMLTGKVWTDNFLQVMRHAARHIPPGRSLSDELIAERRREAAREEREFRKTEAFIRRRTRR
jgi:AbrB family looped-hinge helix DNA binding protein